MDPAAFEAALFQSLPHTTEAAPMKPRSQRFECSDCGRSRRGGERYSCRVCGEYICIWCVDRHERQHPKEARR
jgi:hypothetical protein